MNDQVITCPYCGGTVSLDTPICPDCKQDLSALARLAYGHAIYYNEALALAREEKLDQARDKLLMAIEQQPDFAPAHSLLAKVYAHKGNWAEARARAERVLELLPHDDGARELAQQIADSASRAREAAARASRARAEHLLTIYLRDVARAFGVGVGVAALLMLMIHWIGGGRGTQE